MVSRKVAGHSNPYKGLALNHHSFHNGWARIIEIDSNRKSLVYFDLNHLS